MDFMKAIATAVSRLHAQAGRTRAISENIATPTPPASPPGAPAYRRKIPTFHTEVDRALGADVADVVALGRVRTDPSSFRKAYEPGHPAADANGYVNYVNALVEMTDMRDARRSYEANLNVITAARERAVAILNA